VQNHPLKINEFSSDSVKDKKKEKSKITEKSWRLINVASNSLEVLFKKM
jgi:hypothetical protein